MEIYEILKKDHRLVKTMLKEMDATTERDSKSRRQLLLKLKDALVPHSRAEEISLYEPLKLSAVEEANDLAFQSYEEHHVADQLILELEKTDPEDKRWGALLRVLKENLENHIQEEESELFKKARQSFRPEDAVAMGEEFLALKKEYSIDVKSGIDVPQHPNHEIILDQ